MARLIEYFEHMESIPVSEAYLVAAGISVISVALAFVHHVFFFYVLRVGWHLRVAACALMYKKVCGNCRPTFGPVYPQYPQ